MAKPATDKSTNTKARYAAAKRRKSQSAETRQTDPFQRREGEEPIPAAEAQDHLLGPGMVCDTERRGHPTPTPQGADPTRIVVDVNASEGFIALWAKDTTLRWRFRERSMAYFATPAAAKAEIGKLFGEAVHSWGNAAPVTFTYDEDVWDFEIVMRNGDDCDASGCVLASAFFPDSGRHQFYLYPKIFTQARDEQVDTFIHEIGHVFGLRHFFAQVSESAWPSEIFGTHSKFSIMNYGVLSKLTTADRDDLRRLYQLAWSGALTNVNGTPIRFVKPYHILAYVPEGTAVVGPIPTPFLPRVGAPGGGVGVGPIPAAFQHRSRAAYFGEP